ncbi:hypothetical protein jhhlp_001088 [Lomentospora prolificans]|uniref:GATA-type domain-containing protein n=1 Tax=Lomentospora prolificans TaxID=41688 RepID=A0A2N3NH85_9PEZI|nr:hypothetical protein jhhlp_001088 [Lomentospora prolificans]
MEDIQDLQGLTLEDIRKLDNDAPDDLIEQVLPARPQASLTTLAPRFRIYNNSMLMPNIPSSTSGPIARTTKRGTTIINYAEDGFDDLDDDDDDSRRRPTGLRSARRGDDSAAKQDFSDKVGKEANEPVEVDGQWREWMLRTKMLRSDRQGAAQSDLPLTLIPIRIDVEVPSFMPQPPFPLPPNGYDPSLPQFRPQEMTPPYRLRDFFLWNLHEALITTDQFAMTLVQDLDLPNARFLASEISRQIRTQLEEYAGVALHPLFHAQRDPNDAMQRTAIPSKSGANTPAPANNPRLEQREVGVSTPVLSNAPAPEITAKATTVTHDNDDLNPDDAYRCIISLNITLGSTLYTDKFEWSLLHPPGMADAFAKQTCADLGLHGEWVPAITHGIYEAVLKLKKEACESGGVVGGWGGLQQEIANDSTHGAEAGVRYDPENLGADWQPNFEVLTKEEMEKREGDHERQLRRLRRETARFSSTSGLVGGVPFSGFGTMVEAEEERMGRGERNKKKRRQTLRSLSPQRSGTPGGRGTPDVGYGGGGSSSLMDVERENWRCSQCCVRGSCVWAVRDGPAGLRTLCHNCGYLYERDKRLPFLMKNLHRNDQRIV